MGHREVGHIAHDARQLEVFRCVDRGDAGSEQRGLVGLGDAGAAQRVPQKERDLGLGARGDVTVYTDHPDRERMFQRPRFVFKAGEMIVRDGALVASPTGATHVVKPAYDRAIEKHIADYYQRFMTVRPNNLRVASGEIEDDGRGRLIVHHTGRRV